MPFMLVIVFHNFPSESKPSVHTMGHAHTFQKDGDGRALRRTIFLDELKMPKKPDVKPANEESSSTAWDHWQHF